MRTLLATALAAILFAPASGAAAPLSFIVGGVELGVTFGLAPFSMLEQLSDDSFSPLGSASLVSGPLLDLDVDAVNGFTTYSYGAGTLALILTVDDEHGNPVTGNFVADTLPFSFVVCEGCDSLFGGGTANDFEIQFAGLFDDAIAHALGVLPQADGSIDFGLEAINGDPSDDLRSGFDHRGQTKLELEVATADVPEPGLLLLLMAGGAGWMARRKPRRA